MPAEQEPSVAGAGAARAGSRAAGHMACLMAAFSLGTALVRGALSACFPTGQRGTMGREGQRAEGGGRVVTVGAGRL